MKGTTTVFQGPQTVKLVEFPLHDPPPGGILAEMIRANICGSELHIYLGHHPQIRPGAVLGHEGLGRVQRLGEGAHRDFRGEPLEVGDRIVATYFQACRRCPPCQQGDFNVCAFAYQYWSQPSTQPPHFHGTLGTHYYVWPDQYVFKVPDGVPDESAAMANCLVAQMLYAIDVASVRPGHTVLIQGAGGLGLAGAALARIRGAEVVVTDINAARLDHAYRYGAHAALDVSGATDSDLAELLQESPIGRANSDVVIDVTGVPAAFSQGVTLTAPGGTFVSVGNVNPGQTCEFDPGAFTRAGVTMKGIIRYQPWYLGQALDLLAAHPEVPWNEILDAVYPLTRVGDALADSAARRITRASIDCGR